MGFYLFGDEWGEVEEVQDGVIDGDKAVMVEFFLGWVWWGRVLMDLFADLLDLVLGLVEGIFSRVNGGNSEILG